MFLFIALETGIIAFEMFFFYFLLILVVINAVPKINKNCLKLI